MKPETVIELMQYFSPLEMKIICLVAANRTAEEISRETGLQKAAVQRRIAIIHSNYKMKVCSGV